MCVCVYMRERETLRGECSKVRQKAGMIYIQHRCHELGGAADCRSRVGIRRRDTRHFGYLMQWTRLGSIEGPVVRGLGQKWRMG